LATRILPDDAMRDVFVAPNKHEHVADAAPADECGNFDHHRLAEQRHPASSAYREPCAAARFDRGARHRTQGLR
jgi:hypothetical protein